MTVQVNPNAWPIQSRCYLFNMCGLTCPMVSLNHNSPIMRKPRQDSHGGLFIKEVSIIYHRDILTGFTESWDFHIKINTKCFSHRNFDIWCRYMMRKFSLIIICCRHGHYPYLLGLKCSRPKTFGHR